MAFGACWGASVRRNRGGVGRVDVRASGMHQRTRTRAFITNV